MAKANQEAYHGGTGSGIGRPIQTSETVPDVEPIDWQALDNSNLKPINRVGIPGNKHVGCK